MAKNLLEIFRSGRHQPMSGAALDFSEADVRASAAAYDPAKHEAPIVVGHPATDAPAYGWVRTLTAAGGSLLAEPDQVDPTFAEIVAAGRFKKISAAFYHPDAASNPVPGVYYLRHVGFLGAQPPAVKGLRDAQFADTDGDVVTIEFGEWSDRTVAGVLRSLREWLIAKFSLDDANQAIPDYAITDLQRAAAREAAEDAAEMPEPTPLGFNERPGATNQPTATHQDAGFGVGAAAAGLAHKDASATDGTPSFSENTEPTMPEQNDLDARAAELAEREASIRQREAELEAEAQARATAFAEREARLKEQEEQARIAGLAAFADEQAEAGRLLPREVPGAVQFMAALDAERVIEFGEGEDKQSPKSLEWFQAFVAGLPPRIHFGEMGGLEIGGRRPATEFTAPPGFSVDPERAALHRRALEFMESHAGTDYVAAVKAVSQH